MKINTKEVEISSFKGEVSTLNMSIDTKDTGHLVGLMINSYQKRISPLKETLTNAIDAGKLHPRGYSNVIIKIEYNRDERKHQIAVQDDGTGMSPEIVEKVWMSLGATTKKNDNKQNGGYGVGALAPLSVADSMEIITVYSTDDGNRESHYIMTRDTKYGVKSLKLSNKESDRTTGTIVKWMTGSMFSTIELFELIAPLDNVKIVGDDEWLYPEIKKYKRNTFTIVEHNFNSSSYVKLKVGDAVYNYSSGIKSLDKLNRFNLQESPLLIYIHIPIGELELIQNREHYVDNSENKDKINSHLNRAKDEFELEFSPLFDKINAEITKDEMIEHLKGNTNNNIPIKLGDVKLQIKKTEFNVEGKELNLSTLKDVIESSFSFRYKYKSYNNRISEHYGFNCLGILGKEVFIVKNTRKKLVREYIKHNTNITYISAYSFSTIKSIIKSLSSTKNSKSYIRFAIYLKEKVFDKIPILDDNIPQSFIDSLPDKAKKDNYVNPNLVYKEWVKSWGDCWGWSSYRNIDLNNKDKFKSLTSKKDVIFILKDDKLEKTIPHFLQNKCRIFQVSKKHFNKMKKLNHPKLIDVNTLKKDYKPLIKGITAVYIYNEYLFGFGSYTIRNHTSEELKKFYNKIEEQSSRYGHTLKDIVDMYKQMNLLDKKLMNELEIYKAELKQLRLFDRLNNTSSIYIAKKLLLKMGIIPIFTDKRFSKELADTVSKFKNNK